MFKGIASFFLLFLFDCISSKLIVMNFSFFSKWFESKLTFICFNSFLSSISSFLFSILIWLSLLLSFIFEILILFNSSIFSLNSLLFILFLSSWFKLMLLWLLLKLFLTILSSLISIFFEFLLLKREPLSVLFILIALSLKSLFQSPL